MKKIFILILVFLFLSCSNGEKRTVDNDSSSENPDNDDIENSDDTTEPDKDHEFTEPAEDFESTENENSEHDEDLEIVSDEDGEPFLGICIEEPCKDVGNSTGECLPKGKKGDYVCVCKENHVWFPNKKTCEPVSSFKGLSCTGQIKCYDNEKEIPCPKAGEPFSGQDANYAENRSCLPQNFTVKNYGSDKIVIDNNSGLEWLQKASIASQIVEYSNWRQANLKDLNSILDSGTFDPVINEAYFPDTPSVFFWTHNSTRQGYYSIPHYIPPDTPVVYQEGINFRNGLSESHKAAGMPSNFRYVRETSESTPSCMLVFSSDDYKIADFPYQKLLAAYPELGKTWEEALEYCENLTYAGISDWKLPNRNEAYFAASATSYFIYASDFFASEYFRQWWTSTSYMEVPTKAITYLTANYTTNTKTDIGNIMCVAFDPCPEGEMWNGENCVSSANIAFNNTDNKCGCIEGYTLENSQCVKTCSDDLCKDKAHSTGLCLQTIDDGESQKVQCKCEENYFINEDFECVNPCDEDPCLEIENSDGRCTPTGVSTFVCSCKKGYYSKSNKCIPINSNDCYADYTNDACVNDVADIIWFSTSDSTLKWDEARQYCEDLDEAGYTDWRLPKVEELWTFAKSCTNIPKESCEASEKNCCLSEECIAQCKCRIFQEPNPVDYLWSSSFKIDDPQKVIIFYKYYAILEFFDTKTDVAKVKCVRNIE